MDSFYDVKGNEISKDSIVAEFINNYNGRVTDFNEGSEIRNLLEAFAVYAMGLEERLNDTVHVMDVLNADGEYLDILASQPYINIERIEGVEATGYVLFTITTALLEELLIPAGTVVTSDTGLDFETVTDNTILPGETSRECMVQAVDVGVDGNIPANSIVTKIDGYDAVDGFTVSNPEPFMGGLDYEEDDIFRERILANMSLTKFGSKPYYVSMLMNEFPNAHDILFDTSSEDYTAEVTPNTYEGDTKQAELEQEVMAYLSDYNNILLGHSFNVISPVEQDLDVLIHTEATSDDGLQIIISEDLMTPANVEIIKEVITCYIGGGSLSDIPLEFKGMTLGEVGNTTELTGFLRNALNVTSNVTASYYSTDPFVFVDDANKYKVVFADE